MTIMPSEPTCAGLPIRGDIVARYVVIQLSPSGRRWDIKAQRFQLDLCYQAMSGLDLSRPTRIVMVGRGNEAQIVRAWN